MWQEVEQKILLDLMWQIERVDPHFFDECKTSLQKEWMLRRCLVDKIEDGTLKIARIPDELKDATIKIEGTPDGVVASIDGGEKCRLSDLDDLVPDHIKNQNRKDL